VLRAQAQQENERRDDQLAGLEGDGARCADGLHGALPVGQAHDAVERTLVLRAVQLIDDDEARCPAHQEHGRVRPDPIEAVVGRDDTTEPVTSGLDRLALDDDDRQVVNERPRLRDLKMRLY